MNLYLIGPRGSGKSSAAARVGGILGRSLFATDDWVQTESGQTIAELFAASGQARFRELESRALELAASHADWIVDLGGGAILSDANRRLLRHSGVAVWLFADSECLWRRISADPRTPQTRPPLTKGDARVELENTVAERESIYAACADYEIDTTDLSIDEVARRIAAWFGSVDKNSRRRRMIE